MQGRVLIAAGSDSGGGAGIQADIKTVMALGGYASTAITALTAQNTRGVLRVVGVAPDFIKQQMRAVLDDIGADAVKTGMLHSSETIDAVCDVLDELDPELPVVIDPVMVAQSGDPLLDPDAVQSMSRRLIRHATVLTPNLHEAEQLAGMKIPNVKAMMQAASTLLTVGPDAVLLKGGHLDSDPVTDVLAYDNEVEVLERPRIDTPHTHGTGCTLASAIATGLAQGMALRDAVGRARAYLQEAIRTNPGLGHGHGPVNHAHTVRPFAG